MNYVGLRAGFQPDEDDAMYAEVAARSTYMYRIVFGVAYIALQYRILQFLFST